jgi:phosphonate transport system permease protein
MRVPRARGTVLVSIIASGCLSAWYLGLSPDHLWPSSSGWQQVGRFAKAAFAPALYSESDLATSLLPQALEAALQTLAFALTATSLSLLAGGVLGVLASQRWWRMLGVPRALGGVLYVCVRALIAFMRSIHEVLWALLLLAALGLNPAAAVLAIAVPYAGTLAKVLSEMLDEAPEDSADALALAGAPPLSVFAVGLLPRVLPDAGAYAFYRFECALRSAAVLGFFGFPTLGKRIYEATGELYFNEAWTYLYALIALIVMVEVWSAALRQRLTVA